MNGKTEHRTEVNKVQLYVKQIDSKQVVNDKNEIRLFAIARNESLRLPHFLKYYTELGVDKFFIIDNNSIDDTVEIALSCHNAHVFSVDEPYRNHWNWMEYFLEKYAMDNWCVVVDIDELFVYPNINRIPLQKLARYLESQNYGAIRSFLLDLYPDKPLSQTGYLQGTNPLEFCNFFDSDFEEAEIVLADKNRWRLFETVVYLGGMRDRVFGNDLPTNLKAFRRLPYHLSKISFFKNTRKSYLTQGMHAINGSKISDIHGVVCHTKFMQDFISEVEEEARREEHYGNAILYKIFNHTLSANPSISLWHPNSKKLEKQTQLYEFNLLKTSEKFEEFCLK
jgi:hypothetical protein